ncbi:hypothetical protein DID76_00355 [Candidatus Marinamargulisbacteria bacterium SCGC AG-414-C22]|nr:hypothetical protein DID76_00355 [Candidatus Marinamargulisbacteria bacterium SCGC AG-414-C22]
MSITTAQNYSLIRKPSAISKANTQIKRKNNKREHFAPHNDKDIGKGKRRRQKDSPATTVASTNINHRNLNFDIYNNVASSLPLASSLKFICSSKGVYNEFKDNLKFKTDIKLNHNLFLTHWLKDNGINYKKLTTMGFSSDTITNLANSHGFNHLKMIIKDYDSYVIPDDIQVQINKMSEVIGLLNLTGKGLTTGQLAKIIKKIQLRHPLHSTQNLKQLLCDYNNLTALPCTLNHLNVLRCNSNQLTSLPSNLEQLTMLYCINNKLTVLPSNLDQLTVLYCQNNPLQHYKFKALKIEYEKYMQLINMGFRPGQINDLGNNYGINHLEEIIRDYHHYIIPEGILAQINNLNETYSSLYLTNLGLTTGQLAKIIKKIQLKHPLGSTENLKHVFCDNNNLTAVPNTLNHITLLMCNNNRLTSLPGTLSRLTLLMCNNNLFTSLPLDLHNSTLVHDQNRLFKEKWLYDEGVWYKNYEILTPIRHA